MSITLRPAVPSDEMFLLELYRSTREQEMNVADMSEDERKKFISFQYAARKQHYDEYFANAESLIILDEGEPIGRHMLLRGTTEYRLVLTEILSEYRGKGIGTDLVKEFQEEAAAAGKPVRLQVQKYNGPLRMCRRLGFEKTGSSEFHHQMEWIPVNVAEEQV